MFAHATAQPVIELIERMRAAVGKPKRRFERKQLPDAIAARVRRDMRRTDPRSVAHQGEGARYDAYKAIKSRLADTLKSELGEAEYAAIEKLIKEGFEERKYTSSASTSSARESASTGAT